MSDNVITASILQTIKKNLGIPAQATAYDPDIALYINGVLSTLSQLGIGPAGGFSIEGDAETWDDYLGVGYEKLNSVKTYITLRVRLIFDPPATSYVIGSFEKMLTELEWRMNVERESTQWVNPNPGGGNYELIIDGGDADD